MERRTYGPPELRAWIAEYWPRRHTGFGRHCLRSFIADLRRLERR